MSYYWVFPFDFIEFFHKIKPKDFLAVINSFSMSLYHAIRGSFLFKFLQRLLQRFFPIDGAVRQLYHYILWVLASWSYGNPSKDMIIIGITGTKGKTTTTNIVAKGLLESGKKVFMFSTVNYCINGDFFENKSKMTSPSPFELQELLKKAKLAGCEYAVIETSSHSIYFNRNYGIDYDVVVLTNISQDHLDLHKTMDAYAAVKAKLFQNLMVYRRKWDVKKVAVVNIDSPYASMFLETTADQMYTYGLSASAQIRAQNIESDDTGMRFEVKIPSNTLQIETRLKWDFNVYNLLAAFSVLMSLKVPFEKIAKTIQTTTGIPGRLEEISNNNDYRIYVDYAHTEASLLWVLETVKKMRGIERVVLVFWATGDRDKDKRPKMWRVADSLADIIILTDDDTYSEDSLAIIRDVSVGIKRKEWENFWVIPSREDAIRTALTLARPGDLVLVAGKWAETMQVTQKWAIPWNDAMVIRRILQEIDDNKLAM